MLEYQEGEPQAGQQLFIGPLKKNRVWLFHWTKVGATGLAAGEPPDDQTRRSVLQMTSRVSSLNLMRRSLTVTFKPPDTLK